MARFFMVDVQIMVLAWRSLVEEDEGLYRTK